MVSPAHIPAGSGVTYRAFTTISCVDLSGSWRLGTLARNNIPDSTCGYLTGHNLACLTDTRSRYHRDKSLDQGYSPGYWSDIWGHFLSAAYVSLSPSLRINDIIRLVMLLIHYLLSISEYHHYRQHYVLPSYIRRISVSISIARHNKHSKQVLKIQPTISWVPQFWNTGLLTTSQFSPWFFFRLLSPMIDYSHNAASDESNSQGSQAPRMT